MNVVEVAVNQHKCREHQMKHGWDGTRKPAMGAQRREAQHQPNQHDGEIQTAQCQCRPHLMCGAAWASPTVKRHAVQPRAASIATCDASNTL